MKKYDVVALGELLIDFTENDISAQGNPMYEANPGGAPCNVLAMLTKLHHSVAFIGKVGEDGFGKQLTNAIKKQGIDTTGLCYDNKVHTTLDYVLQRCDILKISDNEIQWFTGKENYDEGIAFIRNKYPNIKLIGLSLGKEGSRAYYNDIKVCKSAYLHDGPLETTGCGDTFCGCMLHTVLEKGLDQLTQEDLEYMLSFANGAASIVSKRKGALGVMPTKEEIIKML